MDYYVCAMETLKPLIGPFENRFDAAEWVFKQSNQKLYCTMSRYDFVEHDIYPRNKAGDEALTQDMINARGRLVYVDESIFPYRSQLYCHMYSHNIEALHEMAQKIGLKRAWFQNKKGFPHYDLAPSKRAAALQVGAIEVTCREMVHLKNQKECVKNEPLKDGGVSNVIHS